MKLYYSPGACSLATRICLHEAGIAAEYERVDVRSKITESGADYLAVNPRGYVPALVLDDGEVVTENVAVLSLLAELEPRLAPEGPLARVRLVEMLSYFSSELHIAFKPFWHSDAEADKARAGDLVARHLEMIGQGLLDLYLLGPHFTVADAYLFVMMRWARGFGVPIPPQMLDYFERIAERPAIRIALAEEGLPSGLPRAEPEPAIIVERL